MTRKPKKKAKAKTPVVKKAKKTRKGTLNAGLAAWLAAQRAKKAGAVKAKPAKSKPRSVKRGAKKSPVAVREVAKSTLPVFFPLLLALLSATAIGCSSFRASVHEFFLESPASSTTNIITHTNAP